MESKPYKTILDNLKLNGEEEIDRLISLGEQESFYIDFKESTTQSSANKLSESDRKNFAKAISGFANTSGGLLIWGIKDNKNGAFSKKKISNPDNFIKLLNNEVSLLTLPPQKEVNSISIKDNNDKGFVITEIPKYYFSPVQVITCIKEIQYKYYIRAGSSFVPANHDIISGLYNRQRKSEIVYLWPLDKTSYQENNEEINCQLGFALQNKGLGVLRDVWINFSTGGLNLELRQTLHTGIFTGWNMWSLALNLITKDEYKFAPQHFLYPFIIELKINKASLPKGGFIYISFGADQSAPKELEFKFKKEDFEKFLRLDNRNAELFISHFRLNKG